MNESRRAVRTGGGSASPPAPFVARAVFAALAFALAALVVASCAHAPMAVPPSSGIAWASAPAADDSTVALYHFDEASGITCADSGPQALAGTYGQDAASAFGRFRNARSFSGTLNSFVLVPASPALEFGPTWTIEAWVNVTAYAPYELGIVASRWTESANEQSWVLAVAGRSLPLASNLPAPPNVFTPILGPVATGRLVFIVQPAEANPPRAFSSTRAVETNRWTHVAVSCDNAVLRLYLDGRLDSQYALNRTTVRASAAPLVIGSLVDPRWLARVQGPLQIDPSTGQQPYYAFQGSIDELRLSRVARRLQANGS